VLAHYAECSWKPCVQERKLGEREVLKLTMIKSWGESERQIGPRGRLSSTTWCSSITSTGP
jgi:hypothetical protein